MKIHLEYTYNSNIQYLLIMKLWLVKISSFIFLNHYLYTVLYFKIYIFST